MAAETAARRPLPPDFSRIRFVVRKFYRSSEFGRSGCCRLRGAKEDPMFAVIRHYHFDVKDGATIDRMVREEFVPLIKKAKGFIRYYWLDTGKGEGASVSVFKDKAGADESIHLAADYVRDHMSK
jgi:hypothetical protein